MGKRSNGVLACVWLLSLALCASGCSGSHGDASATASAAPTDTPASTSDTSSPPPDTSSSPPDTSAPSPLDTGDETPTPEPDATSPAPDASATDTPSPVASATEEPTIPAEPTGLPAAWTKQYERTVDGPEAQLLVRTGDINNLGYGWPAHFTPFSGESTPPHPYPCTPRYGAAQGTDYIMLGTGATAATIAAHPQDGYTGCTTRPQNLPTPIPLQIGALPSVVHVVLLQMFLDDFQAPVFHSQFQVSLNGTRIKPFEDTINALDQTGPVGKLVTLRLLKEYFPLLRSGTLNLYIDDPTTGVGDAYAIDFARLLVNPKKFPYTVAIACSVVDADTKQPIARAAVSAAQVDALTGSAGTARLAGVPAGMVSVNASAVGYDSAVQLLDLPVGSPGTANFELKRHREGVSDLRRLVQQNGSVAIYGIHFDTASSKLRPDSIASLETVRSLIGTSGSSRWIIAGHTDNQGGAEYNLGLSDDRAKSVVAWLEAHGIAGSRLTAKGYGLTRPVADNGTEAGRALNRRVEVSIVR